MTHRFVVNHDGARRDYDFVVEREGRMGWVWLRLVRIEDDPPLPGTLGIENYDPAANYEEFHPMGHLWRARGIHLDGVMRYSLVGAFGKPGYIQLEYIRTP
jgi:hypothetical protein